MEKSKEIVSTVETWFARALEMVTGKPADEFGLSEQERKELTEAIDGAIIEYAKDQQKVQINEHSLLDYEINCVEKEGDTKFEIALKNCCYETFSLVKYALSSNTPLKIFGFYAEKNKATIWINTCNNFSDELSLELIEKAMIIAERHEKRRLEMEECKS